MDKHSATHLRIDDPTSALVIRALGADQDSFHRTLQGDVEQQKGKDTISLSDALKLIFLWRELPITTPQR